jgi:large subunit ribosomal protein L4
MKIAVYNIQGKATGKEIELSDDIFGIVPNEHAIYLDVKQYLANQRQGTHKSKERAEVAYSTRKIKKQKGTGTARAGSRKSPVFVGGGTIFGPRPRDYSFKVNKNTKRLARRSALSLAAKKDSIVVVENFNFNEPKTKDFKAVLKALNIDDKKSLFVLDGINNNVYLSARNLPTVNTVIGSSVNTYNIMNAQKIVFFEGVLEEFQSNLSK